MVDPDNYRKKFTSRDKWMIAVVGGLLFFLLASPFMFSTINNFTSYFGLHIASGGCPNMGGLLLHAMIFIVIVRVLMK